MEIYSTSTAPTTAKNKISTFLSHFADYQDRENSAKRRRADVLVGKEVLLTFFILEINELLPYYTRDIFFCAPIPRALQITQYMLLWRESQQKKKQQCVFCTLLHGRKADTSVYVKLKGLSKNFFLSSSGLAIRLAKKRGPPLYFP